MNSRRHGAGGVVYEDNFSAVASEDETVRYVREVCYKIHDTHVCMHALLWHWYKYNIVQTLILP